MVLSEKQRKIFFDDGDKDESKDEYDEAAVEAQGDSLSSTTTKKQKMVHLHDQYDGGFDPKEKLLTMNGNELVAGPSDETEPTEEETKEESKEEQSWETDWDAWLQSFESDPSLEPPKHLATFLRVRSNRRAAKAAFIAEVDACMNGWNEAFVQNMMERIVQPDLQTCRQELDASEQDIVSTLQENHRKRKSLATTLHKANAKWQNRHQLLQERLWNISGPKPESSEKDDEVNNSYDDDEEKSNPNASEDEDGSKAGSQESEDLETIGQFEPARKSIQTFLRVQSTIQESEQEMYQTLEQVVAGFTSAADNIQSIVERVFQEEEGSADEMEADIRFHLMNNHRRRDELQNQLEEFQKQASNMSANLSARIGGNRQ